MCQTVSAVVTVANKLGLHARPATLFAETASSFGAEIKVRRCDGGEWVDGSSIMQMMLLAATEGTEIEITATSPDSQKVLDALIRLVESGFREE